MQHALPFGSGILYYFICDKCQSKPEYHHSEILARMDEERHICPPAESPEDASGG